MIITTSYATWFSNGIIFGNWKSNKYGVRGEGHGCQVTSPHLSEVDAAWAWGPLLWSVLRIRIASFPFLPVLAFKRASGNPLWIPPKSKVHLLPQLIFFSYLTALIFVTKHQFEKARNSTLFPAVILKHLRELTRSLGLQVVALLYRGKGCGDGRLIGKGKPSLIYRT